MTASELIDLLRVYVEAPSSTEYEDATLLKVINDAYKYIVKFAELSDFYYDQTSTTVSVVKGTTSYATGVTARRFFDPFNVSYNYKCTIVDVNAWPFDNVDYPIYFNGATLNFFKDPGFTCSLTLPYAPVITDMALADSPDALPAEYHSLPTVYAASLIAQIEEKRNHWRSEYQDRVNLMLESEHTAPPMIRQVKKYL